ncbi:MAG: hypothetical protein HQM09_19745 [Candidatus Riflebacteria bacterium]|nr:hypothetical protein [Candidatus Riflebacteria bacterium]
MNQAAEFELTDIVTCYLDSRIVMDTALDCLYKECDGGKEFDKTVSVPFTDEIRNSLTVEQVTKDFRKFCDTASMDKRSSCSSDDDDCYHIPNYSDDEIVAELCPFGKKDGFRKSIVILRKIPGKITLSGSKNVVFFRSARPERHFFC